MKRFARFAPATTLLAIIILLSVAADGIAHDTWLFPRRTSVPVGTRLTLDLTSGMAFPSNETAIEPARIQDALVRLGGETVSMTRRVKGKKSLSLQANLSMRGVATLWITLKPRTLDLTPDQVHGYLHEIGAPDSIKAMYAVADQKPRWREAYTKQAKSFVFVGSPVSDTSWRIPAGLSFEIIPISDPQKISAGDTAIFKVLRNGRPVVAFPVGNVGENQKSDRLDRTDSDGIVRIVAPRRAGRWMLRATDLRRPPAGADADWESVFATLTLDVRSAKLRRKE